jgi:hypothetical protein
LTLADARRVAGEAGLCPAGAEASLRLCRAAKEGARGGTMGSSTLNGWEYSCRLVDLMGRLL